MVHTTTNPIPKILLPFLSPPPATHWKKESEAKPSTLRQGYYAMLTPPPAPPTATIAHRPPHPPVPQLRCTNMQGKIIEACPPHILVAPEIVEARLLQLHDGAPSLFSDDFEPRIASFRWRKRIGPRPASPSPPMDPTAKPPGPSTRGGRGASKASWGVGKVRSLLKAVAAKDASDQGQWWLGAKVAAETVVRAVVSVMVG